MFLFFFILHCIGFIECHISLLFYTHPPIQYDVDSDGVMDIVLTTTDAEIVFLKPDSTIFHGETVKVSLNVPLKGCVTCVFVVLV